MIYFNKLLGLVDGIFILKNRFIKSYAPTTQKMFLDEPSYKKIYQCIEELKLKNLAPLEELLFEKDSINLFIGGCPSFEEHKNELEKLGTPLPNDKTPQDDDEGHKQITESLKDLITPAKIELYRENLRDKERDIFDKLNKENQEHIVFNEKGFCDFCSYAVFTSPLYTNTPSKFTRCQVSDIQTPLKLCTLAEPKER